MSVHRHANAEAFLAAIGDRLRARPVVNQLLLGITASCVADPTRYGPDVRFYTTDDGGAAVQTPPWPVQLAECSADDATRLAHAFAANHDPIAGVAGPDDMPARFAAAYGPARGVTYAEDSALGVFELRTVADVPLAAGQRIIATADHAALIDDWLAAFQAEAAPHDPPFAPGAGARAAATGRVHLWLDADGEPVAYASNNRNVEGWASVGPVYTPPALRGRGYATTLVATVSRYLLAEGRTGCTLFTNLANPTSNAIYERIGYRRVGSAFRYAFSGVSSAA